MLLKTGQNTTKCPISHAVITRIFARRQFVTECCPVHAKGSGAIAGILCRNPTPRFGAGSLRPNSVRKRPRHPDDGTTRMIDELSGMPSALREVHR